MAKELVRCCVCRYEVDDFCSVKKCKVKVKKNRKCKNFVHDAEKVNVRQSLPSTRVPYKFVDRDMRRKEAKKRLQEAKKQKLLDKYINTSIDKKEAVAKSMLRETNSTVSDIGSFKTTADG